jgi:hypothetical protein
MERNAYPCEHVVPVEQEPRHRCFGGPDEVARFFLVEIAPHDRTLCHRHEHDYLMYVLGDAQIVSAPRDGKPEIHRYRKGDCEISSAGLVHVVENLKDTKFRNLLVELPPEVGELRRGSEPRIANGTGVVEAIFQEERISVWSLEMDADAKAEVQGPAIFVTVSSEHLLQKASGDLTVKADIVNEISWLGPDRGFLGSDLKRPMRAVLFQLGRTEGQLIAVRKRADEPIRSLRIHADEPE